MEVFRQMLTLVRAPHPTLDLAVITAEFPKTLAELPVPPSLIELLRIDAPAPLSADDGVREAVRTLLRQGGFKPTGRSKPASEYLRRAVSEGTLGSINLAVDICNVTSLHAGLPISVVDLDRLQPPLSVAIAAPDASYVFNASGQSMDLGGLLVLCDASGPCANAVKDAQRTKTHGGSRRTLSILWGTSLLPGRTAATARWYRELLIAAGAAVADVPCELGESAA